MISGPTTTRQARQLASRPLDFIARRQPAGRVDLTFVLLDWSCRESYHFLDYLNDQTAPRTTYEIIWIEYYARRAAELIRRLEQSRASGRHPDVDTYVALGMPPDVYYHKHLMYNLGIALAAGRIVCFCDSDALAHPNLVESIVEQFDADPNLVLHLDEVRNHDRRFYPFNYPPLDEVVGYGCLNWVNGRPSGLLDTADPLHTRNYGACMCATRKDLLAIGGADMHRDYLGHICGPYEMTFRLANAGRRELWHPSQWLYHVWHPGQAGDQNYAGPHDGAQMSSRALEARQSGRILPMEENPAIARLRTDLDDRAPATLGDLLDTDLLARWQPQSLEHRSRSYRLGDGRIHVLETVDSPADAPEVPRAQPQPLFGLRFNRPARLRVLPALVLMLWHQLLEKYGTTRLGVAVPGQPAGRKILRKLKGLANFLRRMWAYDRHLTRRCWVTLSYLKATGRTELVFYGDGDAARLLAAMLPSLGLKLRAACTWIARPQRAGKMIPTWTLAQVRDWDGPVVIASFVDSAEHVARLQAFGVARDRLIVLE
ncbi:MAG TPA: glycosyltransferase family A protein [Pirellulales bacterium]|jgi:hypothetical protein|nr:glycosyltransferase family A protein [Pirellulales bacterium]